VASIFVIGGIVNGVNHVLGFMAVITAASASLARYGIVLTGASRRRVERSTAVGFHMGILLGLGLFVLDRILS